MKFFSYSTLLLLIGLCAETILAVVIPFRYDDENDEPPDGTTGGNGHDSDDSAAPAFGSLRIPQLGPLVLLDTTTASLIIQTVYLAVGTVLLFVPQILYGIGKIPLEDVTEKKKSPVRWVVECTGGLMMGTSTHSILLVKQAVPPFTAYGVTSMLFVGMYVKWWALGTFAKSGLDFTMPLFSVALTAFAVYAGLVAESKLMVGSVILFFTVNALACICCPKLTGTKAWQSTDETSAQTTEKSSAGTAEPDPLVIYLTRANGFFALGMELQMFLTVILDDDTFQVDPYLALGYAAMPCLGYFVSSFLVARTIPQVTLRHLGHVALSPPMAQTPKCVN